jgi:predicted transcriptional regulator
MRIPVYRSQAQRSNEAPGRRITARMNAAPFIRAELERGSVIGEVMTQVAEYGLMRHKAAVEVQMSESLLAAEEEMRAYARQMQNAPDIQNVFRPDGTGLWADGTAGMRDRLADNIQSRSARDEFKARFNQREQAMRFSLQDEIDARIKARAAAAHAARMSALEDSLSDPFNAKMEDYTTAVLAVRTESDAAIRSGVATQETTRVMNAELAKRVAERTAAAYVFDDPTRAVALAEALDLQDDVDAGRITAQEAYESSGLEDDAAYTFFTLEVLPREQALEIIYGTLGRANRLYSAAQARYESDARALGSRIDTARNVLSSGGVVGPKALEDMMAQAQRLRAARPELLAAVEDLSADYDFISGVRGMNRIELETELERYTGGMLGVGEAGIDTPEEVYRRDVVARALDATVRAEAAAVAESAEAAKPDLRRIQTAAEVIDGVMRSPTPNPLVAEEAMRTMLSAYENLPDSIITEDMQESMAEVQQTMAALEVWRESQPAELAAEIERLRTAIPSAENLPAGVELIDQMAMNQRQANLLSGFMTAQQNALADGQGLAYAQSQGVLIDNPASDTPVVVGEPINLTGDLASIRASLDQRFREIDFIETRFGVRNQNILLPGEIAEISNVLGQGLPSQQAEVLALIADLGQDRAMRIFDDLGQDSRQGAIFAHIGGLYVEGMPNVAVSALRGLQLEKPKALSGQYPARRLRAYVSDAFAESPSTTAYMIDIIDALYTDAAARDKSLVETLNANRYDGFIEQALGRSTIEEINGQSVFLLPGIDVDAIDRLLEDPEIQASVAGAAIANRDSIANYDFSVLSRGRWYPVFTRDGYLMRTGTPPNDFTWTDSRDTPILLDLGVLSGLRMFNPKPRRGSRP